MRDRLKTMMQAHETLLHFTFHEELTLLASHFDCFHPDWHPPSQWPVMLSHLPETLQLALQLS